MALAIRHRDDMPPLLRPVAGLHIVQQTDAAVMAQLQHRDTAEMQRRFDDGHRAYVALLEGAAAAWGWVASRSAEIGELNARFSIAARDRYLWNFVTLPQFRGRGIYPLLLEAIIREESRDADRFWIAYAPENHASGAGIRKAGFIGVAELSFDAAGRAAVRALIEDGGTLAARALGIPEAEAELSQCWRCARAGRVMSCPPGSCACDYQVQHSGCAA